MTTEEIAARIKEKETAIAQLETVHQAYVEQLNAQIARNRAEYYQLLGAINELKSYTPDAPPPA